MTDKKPLIVSEPYYRGAGLIGNSVLFTSILFLINLVKGDEIAWLVNFMPIITVFLMLLLTSSHPLPRIDRRN
jgi:hypothetical protein